MALGDDWDLASRKKAHGAAGAPKRKSKPARKRKPKPRTVSWQTYRAVAERLRIVEAEAKRDAVEASKHIGDVYRRAREHDEASVCQRLGALAKWIFDPYYHDGQPGPPARTLSPEAVKWNAWWRGLHKDDKVRDAIYNVMGAYMMAGVVEVRELNEKTGRYETVIPEQEA